MRRGSTRCPSMGSGLCAELRRATGGAPPAGGLRRPTRRGVGRAAGSRRRRRPTRTPNAPTVERRTAARGRSIRPREIRRRGRRSACASAASAAGSPQARRRPRGSRVRPATAAEGELRHGGNDGGRGGPEAPIVIAVKGRAEVNIVERADSAEGTLAGLGDGRRRPAGRSRGARGGCGGFRRPRAPLRGCSVAAAAAWLGAKLPWSSHFSMSSTGAEATASGLTAPDSASVPDGSLAPAAGGPLLRSERAFLSAQQSLVRFRVRARGSWDRSALIGGAPRLTSCARVTTRRLLRSRRRI